MINPETLPSIRQIVEQYGIAADKKLGQNFIFDLNITDKIAAHAGDIKDMHVIEIGPGPGSLTRSILRRQPKSLKAIEKDVRCVRALETYLVPASNGVLTIQQADALMVEEYLPKEGKVAIIANLPYNIATELLFRWLDHADKIHSMTLMFQKEVADRIVARTRTKDYGWLSIKAQLLCDVEWQFDLPPEVFWPPPKITSSVVTLWPKKIQPSALDLKHLQTICRTVFNQRRKMLRGSMKGLTSHPKEILEKAGLQENARPEELSIPEFIILAKALKVD